jgi:hypothetical protein
MSRRAIAVSARQHALGVLGNQIKMARHDRGWTIADSFGPIEFDLLTGERRPLAGILAGQFCDADGGAVV